MVAFLVDENITPEVTDLLRQHGYKASHINDLKKYPTQIVKDDQIRRKLLRTDQILITKDDDFVKSYVSRYVPEKLLFLHGLDDKKELIATISKVAHLLNELFQEHEFIELNASGPRFPFSTIDMRDE
ncbi:MAG: DUF5615 family PIN-like protein [Bacteroidota bacterium]